MIGLRSTASNDGADDDHIGCDPQQWPHFADEFAHRERLIRTTQSRLFAQALPEFKSAPRRQLELDRLVAPTTAETINGLYKAEVIHRRASWKTKEAVELATLEWVAWFNHHRLLEPIGSVPPAEAEAVYYRQLVESPATT